MCSASFSPGFHTSEKKKGRKPLSLPAGKCLPVLRGKRLSESCLCKKPLFRKRGLLSCEQQRKGHVFKRAASCRPLFESQMSSSRRLSPSCGRGRRGKTFHCLSGLFAKRKLVKGKERERNEREGRTRMNRGEEQKLIVFFWSKTRTSGERNSRKEKRAILV